MQLKLKGECNQNVPDVSKEIFYSHGFHDIILSQSFFVNSKHPHAIKEPFKPGESKRTRKEVQNSTRRETTNIVKEGIKSTQGEW